MERMAIWLVPAEPWATNTRGAIAALAEEWGRAAFEPHVTLATGQPRPLDLAAIATRHRPYKLRSAPFDGTPDFKTSAVIAFQETPAHAALRADVLATFGWDEPPRAPHMSLTYGPEPKDVRFLSEEYEFNAIRAVLYESPVDSQEKVAAWKLGALTPLAP